MAERGPGSAQRKKKGAGLARGFATSGMTVRMALAAALHHSRGVELETNDRPRSINPKVVEELVIGLRMRRPLRGAAPVGAAPSEACSAAVLPLVAPRLAHEAKLDVRDVFSQRSKLRQWRDDEWQVVGLGNALLLEHGSPPRVRFVLDQEKTTKSVSISSSRGRLCAAIFSRLRQLQNVALESSRLFRRRTEGCSVRD